MQTTTATHSGANYEYIRVYDFLPEHIPSTLMFAQSLDVYIYYVSTESLSAITLAGFKYQLLIRNQVRNVYVYETVEVPVHSCTVPIEITTVQNV